MASCRRRRLGTPGAAAAAAAAALLLLAYVAWLLARAGWPAERPCAPRAPAAAPGEAAADAARASVFARSFTNQALSSVEGAPESYLRVLAGRPLARTRAAFSAPAPAADCPRPEPSVEQRWGRGLARVPLDEFFCDARCAAREPELEHVFGVLGLARHKLGALLRLCKAGSVPFLVHVARDGGVRYYPCLPGRVPGTGEFQASMVLLATLAATVQLPEVVFAFDGQDLALPPEPPNPPKPKRRAAPADGRAGLAEPAEPAGAPPAGWMHPMPGVLRYVGVNSSPTALFPTRPAVKDFGVDPFSGAWADAAVPRVLDWDSGNTTILWRGGNTALPWDMDYLWLMPRTALCRRLRHAPGFDVAMTTREAVSAEMVRNGIDEAIRFLEPMDKEGFANFSYHIHVDGNTASVSAVIACVLSRGSAAGWARWAAGRPGGRTTAATQATH